MAGPSLGTLLIHRLDAALGTTLSQQTQIVNRATANPVTDPAQAARPEPVSNTLVRDSRENADRASLNARPGARASLSGTVEAGLAGRGAAPSVTTSATTSLGLAARIILNLFASQSASTAPLTARAPLLNSAPGAPQSSAPSSGTTAATSSAPSAGTNAAASSTSSPGTPQATQSGASVLGTQGPDSTTLLAQTLTRALAQSLQQSGLFYESHLKSMVSGQYRLDDLRREPQAQLQQGRPGVASASAQSASAQGPAAQAAAAPAAAGLGASTTSAQTATGGTAGSGAPASQGAASQLVQQSLMTPGTDPATHGLVRQQLEALADQSIQWRGEAWPGAPMEWNVRKRPEHEHTPASSSEQEAPWQSRIKITLPQLGDITMDVRLAGKQVSVTLQADEDTAPLLRRHTGELLGQMSDRQLELTAVTFIESDTTEADARAQTNTRTPPGADNNMHASTPDPGTEPAS